MKEVLVFEETTKQPISLIGKMAGICWGSPINDPLKNYKRGLNCIKDGHGRTTEFPNAYLILDGYSAKVIRELYTHIGGSPTRLQASTRYIDYGEFKYMIPPSIEKNEDALKIYNDTMKDISEGIKALTAIGIPKEDANGLLPLHMETKIVYKINARALTDMSHQRMCSRAYWEYRELFNDIKTALSNYSEEWRTYCEMCFKPKCEIYGYCPESKGCGRRPKKA